MNQELTAKIGKRRSIIHGLLNLAIFLFTFAGAFSVSQAQSYVQVPAIGGINSPGWVPGYSYGPFANLNVRAAMLYPASELNHLPANLTFNSIGFKHVGTITSSNIQGFLKLYVIPTSDSIYNLSASWDSIMQESSLELVHQRGYFFHMPTNGAFNFSLDSTFTLAPNQGFYFVYEWESAGMVNYSPSLECNTSVSNGYHVGVNNSHWNWVAPTNLNISNNYRHVLHLGYTGSVTSFTENLQLNSIKVYPNPVKEILNIDLVGPGKTATQATLRGLTGKVVKQENLFHSENQIRLTGISPGVYSLHLTSGSETLVKRIVIE